jgi:hypothetical protein
MSDHTDEPSVEDEILRALGSFADDIHSGKPIRATEVRIEQNPDGPLHTQRQVVLNVRRPRTWDNVRRVLNLLSVPLAVAGSWLSYTEQWMPAAAMFGLAGCCHATVNLIRQVAGGR